MARKKHPPQPYKGILAVQMPPEPDLRLDITPNPNATNLEYTSEAERLTALRERREAAFERSSMGYIQRVAALFAEFGINPQEENADAKLWLALAKRHVPAFSIASEAKPGRRTKWSAAESAELFFSILEKIRLGLTANKACLALANEEVERQHPTASIARKRALAAKLRATIHRRWLESKKNPLFKQALENKMPRAAELALREIYGMLKEKKPKA